MCLRHWLILHEITRAALEETEIKPLALGSSKSAPAKKTYSKSLQYDIAKGTFKLFTSGGVLNCVCFFKWTWSKESAHFWRQHVCRLKPLSPSVTSPLHVEPCLVKPPQCLLRALDFLFASCCPNSVSISTEWSVWECSGLWMNGPIFGLLSALLLHYRVLKDSSIWSMTVVSKLHVRKSTGMFNKPLLSMSDAGQPPTLAFGLSVWSTGNPSNAASAKGLQ